MKFDYTRVFSDKIFTPGYLFQYSLTEDELQKVFHKYSTSFCLISDKKFMEAMSARIIRDAVVDEGVDLGINYKQKYEELVELLNPYKIDDDMSPTTTLKMVLKYSK